MLFLPKTLLVYILLVIGSYFLYELFRNKIPHKVKHFILSRSFIILTATFLAGFFITDPILQQAFFTVSGVYLGFWLNEQIKLLEERRKLKFFLGLVWQELRYNRHQLEIIKVNYRFYMDREENLRVMFSKFSSVTALSKLLKIAVYDSFILSGTITALKKDDVFNSLEIAYNDVKYLQSSLEPILMDFDMKIKTHNAISKDGKNAFIDQILKDLEKKITIGAEEVAITHRTVCSAIKILDDYLNSMGVKASEETERKSVLIEDDQKFIKNALRQTPKDIPLKDLFKYKDV